MNGQYADAAIAEQAERIAELEAEVERLRERLKLADETLDKLRAMLDVPSTNPYAFDYLKHRTHLILRRYVKAARERSTDGQD